MKIAMLSRYQGKIFRGGETFIRELSREISKRHQVDVLSGERSDSLKDILKGDYQIVLVLNGGLQSLKASLGRIRKNYKLVISGQTGIGKGEIFNIAIAKPDLYVALTESMFEWAKQWAWGSKVVRIPNGVDLNKFRADGERVDLKLKKPIILSVGALVWYKHHEKTIRAMSLIENVALVIVGEGPEEERLQKLGQELLGDRFSIRHAAHEELPAIYRSADLFVLPSWDREAFGIVYIEAMASGLGIVAPNDSSRKEIVGEAGILVDTADPKKYAQAIEQALKQDWKNKALNQAKKFSWEDIAKDYERAFEEIL